MACNPDFVQYIIDQCSGAGEIAVKKMMGDYCAYCDGVLFGLICDNNFYVKVTEPSRAVLKEVQNHIYTFCKGLYSLYTIAVLAFNCISTC